MAGGRHSAVRVQGTFAQRAAALLGVLLAACALEVCSAQTQQPSGGRFSCQGRASGYYADVQAGCQIYHMCDTLGRQFSYSCPNTTLFQQRMLICDHWYMVNCSKSEVDYDANLLIGQREKPFVADDDEHPYHRTPRPDLLAHPSASEYNIVYRIGRAHAGAGQPNLVGGDQPYFLPSHWSTEHRRRTTPPPAGAPQKEARTKKPYYAKPPEEGGGARVNFKSDFKATTPVYPGVAPAEAPLADDDDDGDEHGGGGDSTHQPKVVLVAPPVAAAAPRVNFASSYRATTPVYPKSVAAEAPLASVDRPPAPNLPYGLSSIVEPPRRSDELEYRPPVVNFPSNFAATTPVYPAAVTTERPLAVEEEARLDPSLPALSAVVQPPRGYDRNAQNTLFAPAVYVQPPAAADADDDADEVQARVETRSPFAHPNDARVVIANLNWQELRRALFIPDVQFPLDASARRPAYGDGPDSFQVNPGNAVAYELRQRKHATN